MLTPVHTNLWEPFVNFSETFMSQLLKQPLLKMKLYKLWTKLYSKRQWKHKNHHFLTVLLLFKSIIYVLNVTYVCFLYMVKTLYNGLLLCISSQVYVRWHQVGSLKLSMVRVFIPWKSANTKNQGLINCSVDRLDLRGWWEKMLITDST